MSVIKEFREFFKRVVSINYGDKRDQEVGFPTTTTVKDLNGLQKVVYNRFVDGGYPTEDVFAKLLESITFKLNVEDTATDTVQGLVKTPSTSELESHSKTDSNGYSLYLSPNTGLKRTVKDNHTKEIVSLAPRSNKAISEQTLDATKSITYSSGVGNTILIKKDTVGGYNILEKIIYADAVNDEMPELYLINSGTGNIIITHDNSGTEATIHSNTKANVILSSGSIAKLIGDYQNKSWHILYINSPNDSVIPTGTIVPFAGKDAVPDGWLFCDGKTIGDVGTGADYESYAFKSLFEYLKQTADNTGTEVWGNNTVKLPDLRKKHLIGLDPTDVNYDQIGKTITTDDSGGRTYISYVTKFIIKI